MEQICAIISSIWQDRVKSMVKIFMLALFVKSCSGCGAPELPLPDERSIKIPDDILKRHVLPGKPGENETIVDGRQYYTAGYRAGWKLCFESHQRGKLNLRDETHEPPPDQEDQLFYRARKDGYKACRQMLAAQN